MRKRGKKARDGAGEEKGKEGEGWSVGGRRGARERARGRQEGVGGGGREGGGGTHPDQCRVGMGREGGDEGAGR